MSRRSIHVGLEIGTTRVRAVVAESSEHEYPRILGIGEAQSRGVRKGEIVDFNNASKCVHDALADAQDRCDKDIDQVYLAVTGGHVQSFKQRCSLALPEDTTIGNEHLDNLEVQAATSGIPRENQIIHAIAQRYFVDGQEGVLDPVGMTGRLLEADFQIVHGSLNRIQNSVKCVEACDVRVASLVVSPLASSMVVLEEQQKRDGAIVIDIGGGSTDYAVFVEGALAHSGVVAVGGDHVTNDICIALRLPNARAERLKIDEGSVSQTIDPAKAKITMASEIGFFGRDIERDFLNYVVRVRMQELLEIVRDRIAEDIPDHAIGAGVFLTGGTSLLEGLSELAESVFNGMPVTAARAHATDGPLAALKNPGLSTAIGLVHYARTYDAAPDDGSLIGRVKSLFSGRLRIL